MFKYFIRYNVYTGDKPPREESGEEITTHHIDEQGLKKILETRHGAKISLISWKEVVEKAEKS